MPYSDPAEQREAIRRYRANLTERSPEEQEDLRRRQRESRARWREKNRDRKNESSRLARRKIKAEALDRYGTTCAVCGIDDIRVLQIDHVENNGNVERAALGGYKQAGHRFYEWLKKQGWPDGYQTLCANHNLIKHFGENF